MIFYRWLADRHTAARKLKAAETELKPESEEMAPEQKG
jgi:hypothetical protein